MECMMSFFKKKILRAPQPTLSPIFGFHHALIFIIKLMTHFSNDFTHTKRANIGRQCCLAWHSRCSLNMKHVKWFHPTKRTSIGTHHCFSSHSSCSLSVIALMSRLHVSVFKFSADFRKSKYFFLCKHVISKTCMLKILCYVKLTIFLGMTWVRKLLKAQDLQRKLFSVLLHDLHMLK